MAETLDVSIWRGGADGHFEDYAVPHRTSQTVLDVVTWVQRNLESTLSYRFACRVGMCGSCAMMVNGRPRWTCRSHVSVVAPDLRLEIAPLRNLPVIKDLACDMTDFFERWQRAEGKFQGGLSRHEPVERILPDAPQRRAADAGIQCINCAVCYAACDVVARNPDYLGPAALNRAWTLQNDGRDQARAERLRVVANAAGCHACHSHQSCALHCPKHLNPTASIAGLKAASFKAALKGGL